MSKVIVLDRNKSVVARRGEGEYSREDWGEVRNQAPESFAPGRFVCPHGACFNHESDIFVVEWVESGRVTKLRRVSLDNRD